MSHRHPRASGDSCGKFQRLDLCYRTAISVEPSRYKCGAFNIRRTPVGYIPRCPKALQEKKMSMFETLARYGAAFKNAREARKSERVLNSLPIEIQKDIGWPVTPRSKRLSSNT